MKLFIIAVLTLLVPTTSTSTEKNHLTTSEFYFPSSISQEVQFLEEMKSKRKDPSLNEIEIKTNDNKLSGSLEQSFEQAKCTDVLKVSISLHHEADEKQFEQKVIQLLGSDVDMEKFNYHTYDARLNKKQIELLLTLNEVTRISSPDIKFELN